MGIFYKLSELLSTSADRPVPEWNTYYPDLSSATAAQRSYYAYWMRNIRRGTYPDLGNNLSYFFVYAYDQIYDFLRTKNVHKLQTTFGELGIGYPDLAGYLDGWLGDAYLYLADYDAAWGHYRKNWDVKNAGGLRVMDFLNIKFKARDANIDGRDIVLLLGTSSYAGITKFGKEHINEVVKVADLFLKDFQVENGKNLIEFHLKRVKKHYDLSEQDFDELKVMIGDQKEFLSLREHYFADKKREAKYPEYEYSEYGHGLFAGVPGETPTLSFPVMAGIVEVAVLKQARKILREAENTVREEMGIPKIGEGWVSETELYYKLKKEFPAEEVLHHGRPEWLRPQHLDIFFPKYNIGIEFQGQQHLRPVDFFGGEKSFSLQVERDLRKKKKCEKSSCNLIYVYDGYDFSSLKKEISALITHDSKVRS